MKTSSLCAVTGFLLATLAGGANAQNADFVLANNTGFSVHYVFFWPTATGGPGPDRLGDNTIPSGANRMFTPRDGECSYNIRVRLENGEYEEWNDVDLCSVSTVTLNYDYLSKELWASTSNGSFRDSVQRAYRYGAL